MTQFTSQLAAAMAEYSEANERATEAALSAELASRPAHSARVRITIHPVDSPYSSAVAQIGNGSLILREPRCFCCETACRLVMEIDDKVDASYILLREGARGFAGETIKYEEIEVAVES